MRDFFLFGGGGGGVFVLLGEIFLSELNFQCFSHLAFFHIPYIYCLFGFLFKQDILFVRV